MILPSRSPRGLMALAWVWTLGLAGVASAQVGHSVTVRGNGHDLGETPVIVEVDPGLKLSNPMVLKPRDGGPSLPANVFQDRGKTYLGLILDRVTASGSREYELREGSQAFGIEMTTQGARIEVRDANKPLTTYIPDDGPKPYYFPLIGPTGRPVTRSFPMAKVAGEKYDHPHHRSAWFTHGSVNKVDFWSEAAGHGTIKETSRPTVVSGSAVGLIRTTDDWIGPDGKKVCEDERVVRFFATTKARVIDFDVTLKANAGPVTFGDTKEGMFGLRVATSMDLTGGKGHIVNAEGVADKAAWGKASPWVDYTGPVDGKAVGIAILNHPDSFRSPTTWHVRDYGLFAANPFGWKDFGQKTSGEYVLPAGESIRFAYRVILHEGDATSAGLPDAFEGYAHPPKVTVGR